jgi:dTDP-4-amino-4,6-dideoxygalactose transaminase
VIPLVDVKAQYAPLIPELKDRFAEVLDSGRFIFGPEVEAFEREAAAYLDVPHAIGVANGTDALVLSLEAMGVGAGDEVICPSFTFYATSEAIARVGATPVFADIDPVTRNIDLDKLEAAITPRTRAIIPVHLAGLPVDMDRLYAIADKHKLRVVEDAAQAFGSTWKGRRIGSFGDFVSFSFQVNKNLTTGEGGCLVLNTPEEAVMAEKFRLQGVTRSGVDGIDVDVLGGKYNMTDIAAAIGLGQMKTIAAFNAHRRVLAQHYFDSFGPEFEAQTGAQLPLKAFDTSNWHLFQIILPDRGPATRADFMTRLLKEHQVGTGFHYAAIHLFTLYRERGFVEGMFPESERIGRLTVTLPMFYAMTTGDVERVVRAVKAVLAK